MTAATDSDEPTTRHVVEGRCHCGNIVLRARLTRPPQSYEPRACDCDFCCLHGAAYVSDPKGCLEIRVKESGLIERYHHGSQSAEFLICQRCGVYVGALYRDVAQILGVVNIRVLDPAVVFGTSRPISPKALSSGDKIARWRTLWFPVVEQAR